jgi:hypothetical protein
MNASLIGMYEELPGVEEKEEEEEDLGSRVLSLNTASFLDGAAVEKADVYVMGRLLLTGEMFDSSA